MMAGEVLLAYPIPCVLFCTHRYRSMIFIFQQNHAFVLESKCCQNAILNYFLNTNKYLIQVFHTIIIRKMLIDYHNSSYENNTLALSLLRQKGKLYSMLVTSSILCCRERNFWTYVSLRESPQIIKTLLRKKLKTEVKHSRAMRNKALKRSIT